MWDGWRQTDVTTPNIKISLFGAGSRTVGAGAAVVFNLATDPIWMSFRQMDNLRPEFARLLPRMRECLRLVYNRKRTGEIATMIGVEQGTVKSYIADAVRILGARDRIDAAERLHAYETGNTPTDGPPPSSGVGNSAFDPPNGDAAPLPIRRWRLPIRQSGTSDNDLTIAQRALWVVATPVICAITFGMLAVGLRIVSDLAHAAFGFRR